MGSPLGGCLSSGFASVYEDLARLQEPGFYEDAKTQYWACFELLLETFNLDSFNFNLNSCKLFFDMFCVLHFENNCTMRYVDDKITLSHLFKFCKHNQNQRGSKPYHLSQKT